MNHIVSIWLLLQELYPHLSGLCLGALKITGILLVASGLAMCLRHRSALARSWVWRFAFGALLLMSVWQVKPEMLDRLRLRFGVNQEQLELPEDLKKVAQSWPVMPGGGVKWQVQPQGSRPMWAAQFANLRGTDEPMPPWVHPGDYAFQRTQMQRPWLQSAEDWCRFLWLAGLFLLVGWRLVRSGCGLAWLWRRSSPAECRVQKLADAEARSAHLCCFPECRFVTGLGSPVLSRVQRPIIWLPETARSWSDDKIRYVIRHELAHQSRRDGGWQWLATIVSCFWWWHPLAWRALSQLRTEAELAADELVGVQDGPDAGYAAVLVEIASDHSSMTCPSVGVPMLGPSPFARRIEAILAANSWRGRTGVSGWLTVGVLLVLSFAVSSVAVEPVVWVNGRKVRAHVQPLDKQSNNLAAEVLRSLERKHRQLRLLHLELESRIVPGASGDAASHANDKSKAARERVRVWMDAWSGVARTEKSELNMAADDSGHSGNTDAETAWTDGMRTFRQRKRGPVEISEGAFTLSPMGFSHEYEVMRILETMMNAGVPFVGATPCCTISETIFGNRRAISINQASMSEPGALMPMHATRYVIDPATGSLLQHQRRWGSEARPSVDWQVVEQGVSDLGITYPRHYQTVTRWERRETEVRILEVLDKLPERMSRKSDDAGDHR